MNRSLIVIFFLISACNNGGIADLAGGDNAFVESLPINPEDIHIAKGDCFSFRDSAGKYFVAIVIGFHKAKDGIWYNTCFTGYYDSIPPSPKAIETPRLCGRKVMYSVPQKYMIGLDAVYVRDTTVDNNKFALIGNIDLQPLTGVEISGWSNAYHYKDFTLRFKNAYQNRLLPPDHYTEAGKNQFRPDEYFTISQIKEWRNTFRK